MLSKRISPRLDLLEARKSVQEALDSMDGEQRAYILAALPGHVVSAQELELIGDLLRTDFLDRKARELGEDAALADAGALVNALTAQGDIFWHDIAIGAQTYCALTAQMRDNTKLLPELAAHGDSQRVEALLAAEESELRRGLMLLAVSGLFAEAGYLELAGDFHARAQRTLERLEPGTETYGLRFRLLARALLTHRARSSSVGSKGREMPPTSDVQPKGNLRPTMVIPFIDTAICYAVGDTSLPFGLCGLVVVGYWLRHYLPHWMTSDAFVIPYIVFAFSSFGLSLFGAIALGKSDRTQKLYQRLKLAYDRTEDKHQSAIVHRALRHRSFLRDIPPGPNKDLPLCEMVSNWFHKISDTQEAAAFLQKVTLAGYDVVDTIAPTLCVLPNDTLGRLWRLVCEMPDDFAKWQLMRITVELAPVFFDPRLTFNVLTREEPDRIDALSSTPPVAEENIAVELLRRLSRRQLALTLLEGLSRHRQDGAADSVEDRGTPVPRFQSYYLAPLLSPMSIFELPLWILTYLPTACLVGAVVYFTGPIIFSLYVAAFTAGRTHDAFGLRRFAIDTVRACSLEAAISANEVRWPVLGLLTSPEGLVLYRLRHLLICRSLLRSGPIEAVDLEGCWQREVQRAIKRLGRSRMLRKRTDLVVASMATATTLNLVLSTMEGLRDWTEPIQLTHSVNHAVKRAIPLSTVRSVIIGVLLSIGGGVVFVAAFGIARSFTGNTRPLPIGGVAVLCIYFVLMQHIPLPRMIHTESKRLSMWVSTWFKGMFVVCGSFLLSWALEVFGANLSNISVAVAVGPLFIANVVVPELIARWRSAPWLNRTYELWVIRAAWVACSIGGCALLAAAVSEVEVRF